MFEEIGRKKGSKLWGMLGVRVFYVVEKICKG